MSLVALAVSLTLGASAYGQNTPSPYGGTRSGAAQSGGGGAGAQAQSGQRWQAGQGAYGGASAHSGQQADQQILQQLSQIQQDPNTAADKLFVLMAAVDNQCEIQLAQQAQQKAQSPQVKQLAQQIVQDHQSAQQQLQQTAQALRLQLPQGIQSIEQQKIQIMASLPSDQFDKQFVSHNQAAHAKAVTKYQAVSQLAQNDQVKQYASQTLPRLQHHFQQANAAAAAVGLPSAGSEAQPASGQIPPSGSGTAAPGSRGDTSGSSGATGASGAYGTSGASGASGASTGSGRDAASGGTGGAGAGR